MRRLVNWLRGHRFEAHLAAFLLMILPPIPLFIAARSGVEMALWPLIALVVLGNLIAIAVR